MPIADPVSASQEVPKVEKVPMTAFPPFQYSTLFDRPTYGDWRDELVTEGFTVIRAAIPVERALKYREKAFRWLESFGLGFDRDDPSTWRNEHLPVHIKGGMFHSYGFSSEQFVWDIRTEPGVVKAFARIWGTDELVTSFDAGSIMLPKRTDVKDSGKWEHMDQSPARTGLYCVQGLVNLNVNGPDDGGLMVLRGSSKLVEEYFDETGRTLNFSSWGPVDWYGFSVEQQQWFFDRGCVWEKVCAGPGDLILWDSRTMHYNVRPTGERDRVCTYVCMAPAHLLSEEDRKVRAELFETYRGTTHVPFAAIYSRPHEAQIRVETGLPCPHDTGVPKNPRKETDEILRLAGLQAY